MAMEVRCPGCEKILRLPDSAAGKRGKCPACGTAMEIPAPDEEEPVMATLSTTAPGGVVDGLLGKHTKNRRRRGGSPLVEFLRFRRMVTPVLIHAVFWIGVAVSFSLGGWKLYGILRDPAASNIPPALLTLGIYFIAAPVLWRIVCEILIVLFRIHADLVQIEKNTTPKE